MEGFKRLGSGLGLGNGGLARRMGGFEGRGE